MAIYRAGTASMNANGVITGVGTKWQDKLSLIRVGATMVFMTQPLAICTISAIVSDTELRATQTDGKVVPAGTNYVILLHDSITVDGLAQDVAETLRYYQSKETVIEDAIEFFQNFDFEKYKETADQVKADAAAAAASQVAAKTSETNAKTSETNAKASETAAAASRTAAAASQTAAKTSETNAKTSETNANSSKVAAAASQTAAKTSETNAKTSETNAKTSETNAANSRTAAASSATAAAGSASSADVSKTAAATSAGQAAGSATAAAGSATAAAGSATTAGNQATTATQQATLAKQYADSVNPANLLNKNNNLSDVANVDTAKNNLGLSFITQTSVSKWAQMYSPRTDGALGRGAYALTMAADGTWGARKTSDGSWSALEIAQGGTGSNSASGARSNLQVDKLAQSSASTNLNYPTKNAALVLRDSDLTWGVYSNDAAKWLSLGIGQGGTGATDAVGARDNLQLGVSANPQFNSLIVQPQASSGLSAIELRPHGSSGSYPKSTIYGISDGTCQIHTYDSSNARKRYFFSDQIGNPTPNSDRTVVTTGDFGLGAGVSGYATPANHGAGSAFIAGSSLGWMPGGAGIQASYDSARTGQLVIRPNGSVVFRWVQNGNPESTEAAAPYTTLQNAGTSDINLKHVNGDLDVNVALENIENMEFKRFYYLSDEDKIERRGVIAQQIEEIDPEYVHSAEGTGKMTLDLNPLLMDCLAAIKALNAKISKLEEEVEKLKSAE